MLYAIDGTLYRKTEEMFRASEPEKLCSPEGGGRVNAITISPGGTRLLLECENAGLLLYTFEDTRAPLAPPQTIKGPGEYSCYALNEKTLYYGTTKGHVRALPLEEEKAEEIEVAVGIPAVTCISVSPDGALLAWGAADGGVAIYRPREEKTVAKLRVDNPRLLIISQENRHVIALSGDSGDATRWDTADLEAGEASPA